MLISVSRIRNCVVDALSGPCLFFFKQKTAYEI